MNNPLPFTAIANRTIHVAADHAQADDQGPGSPGSPLRSINAAAARAMPGDTILIAPGTYRETVAPPRGGLSGQPITYQAARPGTVVITGSESWQPTWTALEAGLFAAQITVDGDNPFADTQRDLPGSRCRGQLVLDGEPLRQALDEDDLHSGPGSWRVRDGGQTLVLNPPARMTAPPAEGLALTVRDVLFRPAVRGLGHLRLVGLTFAHCANRPAGCFWEADGTQQGAVTTAAGHHWEIVGCTIRHAQTIGLDIGTSGGREQALGTPTEEVGHHLIHGNLIEDIGQCGLCGIQHHGVRITGNRVRRCNNLGFQQAEEAGIKLHFVFDAMIAGNIVEDNDAGGIWLDNQWYGTRITANFVSNNMGSGIFVEMGDGACLVDNNVVVETRLGDGIYTHDSSGVTIAHNLLMANAHFGIYMRTVTERTVGTADGRQVQVGTCRQQLTGNLCIDNYRGHVCLPLPNARDHDNRCDGNLYLNGGQWQWEGLPFHRFVIGCDDGRITPEAISTALGDRPAVRGDDGSAQVDLATWQAVGGWDLSSLTPVAHRGTIENGAVAKGSLRLSSRDRCLVVKNAGLIDRMRVAPPIGVDRDYHGNPLPTQAIPGPFQRFPGPCLSLTPRPAR